MKRVTVQEAYKRMRKRGIITTPIRNVDFTTKMIGAIYQENLDNLEKTILNLLKEYGVKQVKGELVNDSIEGLIAFLERQGAESVLVKKLIGNMEILIGKEEDPYKYVKLKQRMKRQFGETADHFFKDLLEDADANVVGSLVNYALNKDVVFQSRVETLKELYIDNAIERINGEQNELKANFLEQLSKWSTGEISKLNVKDLIADMKKTAVSEARFFARDQYGKFNKALLIASFRAAGVHTVELITCHDNAVRPEHKAWDRKRFAIDNIPLAWYNDYNCRCGAKAVWD